MRLHKHPPNMLKQADVPSLESPAPGIADEEYDQAFRDLIESITVTAEQLAAIIGMPEFSIQEVKRFLQDGENSRPRKNPEKALNPGRRWSWRRRDTCCTSSA